MFFFSGKREDLLTILPKGAVVAEIGVAKGKFSRAILQAAKPKKLHLIDPWIFQDNPDYLPDDNNVSNAEHQSRFDNIKEMFAGEIASGQVELHRSFSHDAAPEFPDNYFDWIYVDAMHTFDAVLRDLTVFAPKVKADGFILGHDYAAHADAVAKNFSVIPAVHEFIRRNDAEFLALSGLDIYPTYVLCKERNKRRDIFLGKLLDKAKFIVEIRNPMESYFTHKRIYYKDKNRVIPSFS